jgi:3-oxoacyl-[acyl-carrier protein] reductase
MTHALLDAGHRVAIVARNQKAIDAVVARAPIGRCFGVAADITEPAACERAIAETVAHYHELHALVNNAGINLPTLARGTSRRFYESTPQVWSRMIDTNVNAPFYMARAAIPHLLAAGWGRIVNHVTSYRGMGRGGNTPYGPSKAALEAATVAWSEDLAGTGVTVNAILPGGAADTAMISREIISDRSELVPPARLGPPITWLLSGASDSATGKRVVAALWDAAAPLEDNLAAAVSPAGWPETMAVAPSGSRS